MANMTAVEVVEWLCKNYYDCEIFEKVFGCYDTLDQLSERMTSEEIVQKIEEYEAKKNHIADAGKMVGQEFNVGDYVRTKDNSDTYKVVATTYDGKIPIIAYPEGSDNFIQLNTEFWEHAEPPKNNKSYPPYLDYQIEKQEEKKIDYIGYDYGRDQAIINKMNELVDAVNKLNGCD